MKNTLKIKLNTLIEVPLSVRKQSLYANKTQKLKKFQDIINRAYNEGIDRHDNNEQYYNCAILCGANKISYKLKGFQLKQRFLCLIRRITIAKAKEALIEALIETYDDTHDDKEAIGCLEKIINDTKDQGFTMHSISNILKLAAQGSLEEIKKLCSSEG